MHYTLYACVFVSCMCVQKISWRISRKSFAHIRDHADRSSTLARILCAIDGWSGASGKYNYYGPCIAAAKCTALLFKIFMLWL